MLTKEDAKRYIGNTPPERCFWLNDGSTLKNLEELSNAFPRMSDETFRHHVNGGKNDFSNWVKDVIGDKKLAHDLMASKNKVSALKKLRSRLNSLKKKAS